MKKTPFWLDSLLIVGELASKQIYWRLPWAKFIARKLLARSAPALQTADYQEFKAFLRSIGVVEGALVMAHTSIAGMTFTQGPAREPHPVSPVKILVDSLMELVGTTGTLVMPTHAIYQNEDEVHSDDLPPTYNPASTPCGVGLASEVFRRRKGVKRSLHPYNMVSVYGPLADELLKDNLNDTKPLPHGIHSPYYRFCQKNGLVVSIGIPLGPAMTLTHVGSESRAEHPPFADFFMEKKYIVSVDGEDREVLVRVLRPAYFKYCRCRYKYVRDLIGAGILHRGKVGSITVEWAHSREVYEYFMARNEHSTYPYFCPWLARISR